MPSPGLGATYDVERIVLVGREMPAARCSGQMTMGRTCCLRVAPVLRQRKMGCGIYIRLYLGPLPPSRGVQRGPSTSVALQSTQLGGFTRSTGAACGAPTATSYTPAGHTCL